MKNEQILSVTPQSLKGPLRLAILSDTHAHVDPRILAVVAHCDAVIHAGDVCGAHVLEQLTRYAPELHVVAGNNDADTRWRQAGATTDRLPDALHVRLPGGLAVVEHGHRFGNHPDHGELRKAWPEARLVIYGHTHRKVIDQSESPWVVNPGAAGRTRVGEGPSLLVLTIADENDWRIDLRQFEVETPPLARAV